MAATTTINKFTPMKKVAERACQLAMEHYLFGEKGEMRSSAQACIECALYNLDRGNWDLACKAAKKSLAYSVGVFHPDYKSI